MTGGMPGWAAAGAFLTDYTVQTVALGAAILGATAGALGCFALLRRQSLLGDTLAHAALPGLCLGFLLAGARELPALLAGAALTGAAAALAVQAIARSGRLKPDAAQGIVLSVFFALGVVGLTALQGRGTAGLSGFLFGQAAAMLRADLWTTGGLALAALTLLAAFWKEAKLITFDPGFAAVQGLPVAALETGLTLLVAVAVLVGLPLVGVVLMTAMLVAPAAAARAWTDRLGRMVLLAAAFGAAAGVTGALISAAGRGLATGPLIVLTATAIVAVSFLLAPGRGLVWAALRRRRARARAGGLRLLGTLEAIARRHGDPAFPAEEGLIDAARGQPSGPALRRLAARGLVRAVPTPPDAAPGWSLTEAGRAELARGRGARPGAATDGGGEAGG